MEADLPPELLTLPLPPVALIGLDATGAHAPLWKALNLGGGSKPLRWLLIDDPGNDLPKSPKARRTSYEWFIPKGILKTNWMNKYLNVVPSVAVIFSDLEWDSPEWNERKMECAARVQAVRAALAGRGTKIALVLVQRKEMAPPAVASDENSASERATALCSACELSARSLFVLPINAENLSGYISRLENAFNDLAQNYYHQEIRGVKAHKDFLNKTTHLYLFVRHQFKGGFLNELKRDLHAAYKHYSQAYNLLMEVRASDTNIMEVKTVGGFINYKMCKLAFQLNLPRDAISQFRRHMDIFQHKVGLEELAFEHRGWQANQCSTFASMFANAIKQGLPAIQTQHPGLYYQQAATYAVQRRKLAEELCSEALTYPEPDPLISEDTLEYYGQRPWRPGKVSIEPPDMDLEKKGISALLYRERNLKPTHSEVIVDLLRKSIEHYKIFRSPRAESNLIVQMAEELVSSQRCSEALELLKPIVAQYRKDGWKILLKAALQLTLKCAFLVASVSDYVAFGLELAAHDDGGAIVENEERCRIVSNICKILSVPPKIPSAEPGLTSKSERAAVGEASKLWSRMLLEGKAKVVDIPLGPEVYDSTALIVNVVFPESQFKADEAVTLACHLHYDASSSVESDMPIFAIELILTWEDEAGAKKLVKSLKWEGNLLLKPGQKYEQAFSMQPEAIHVGKELLVEKAMVSLGSTNGLHVVLQQSIPRVLSKSEYENDFPMLKVELEDVDVVDGGGKASKSMRTSITGVRIDQREPKIKMEVIANGPSLVGEWFHIKVKLRNDEASPVEDVSLMASLEEANDLIIADTTRLTLDYKSREPETPATPEQGKEFFAGSPPAVKQIPSVEVGQQTLVTFYIRSSTTGNRGIIITASYKIREGGDTYNCHLTEKLSLETVEPFLISTELLSCRNQQKLQKAFSEEPFLLLPEVKTLSKHAIRIIDTSLELRPPVIKMGSQSSQLQKATLYHESTANECYAVKVSMAANSLEMQDLTLGKYVMKWVREEYFDEEAPFEAELCAISNYELQSVKVCQSSLYAEAKVPACAVARVPFGVVFKLTNRTDFMLEFNLSMESSEAFMLSGNKQQHFRIPPQGASHELHYVFYPLLAGEAVPLPQPKLSSVRPALPHDDMNATLQRLLPANILVLPRSRGKHSPSVEKKVIQGSSPKNEPFYQVSSPVFVPRVPFPKVKAK